MIITSFTRIQARTTARSCNNLQTVASGPEIDRQKQQERERKRDRERASDSYVPLFEINQKNRSIKKTNTNKCMTTRKITHNKVITNFLIELFLYSIF